MAEFESVDIWQARYRDLERTLEHVMVQVAHAMGSLEERLARAEATDARPAQLRIRKLYQDPDVPEPTVVCVADGENLAYRWSVLDGGRVVHESPEVRTNSYRIPDGVAGNRVGVHVVSHVSNESAESSCRLEVTK